MKSELKVEELRIGNIIGCKIGNDAGTYHVVAIPKWTYESSQPVTIDRCGYETHPVNKLRGIELTEEWLMKFGFNFNVGKSFSLGYKKEYKVYRLGLFVYNQIQATWWYHGVLENQPKYVHQLQNLYYAITGTDLTIKEPVQ